jgi:hypothetical protein
MLARLRARVIGAAVGTLVSFLVGAGCSGNEFQAADDDDPSGGTGGSSNGGTSGTSGAGGEGDTGGSGSGACDALPCENAGRCVETSSGDASCECAPGFSGIRCETNIDDCTPNPCDNGGICVDSLDAFRCECAPGFAGDRCEDAVDPCERNPCRNGGLCVTTTDGFHCDCAEGFVGAECETNVDDCEPNPCENGGSCLDGVDEYVCECPPGFAGVRCELDITGCSPNPCRNGGTCSGDGMNVTCECTPGFTGSLCERTRYIDVVAGQNFSCALAGDGAVTCWGLNDFGQTDATIDLLDSISDGAMFNTCGLAGDIAICWGLTGQVPDGEYLSISGGAWDANCGVTSDGTIRCWGGNAEILAGIPDTPAGEPLFAFVTLGDYFGCALDAAGGVACWGSNFYGQVANAPRTAGFTSIDSGSWRACGIRNGAIVCWGLPPGELPTGTFSSVSVGIEHGCALRTNRTIACWESPAHTDGRAIAPDGDFLLVSAGADHSCAVRADNGIECWGDNKHGQVDGAPGF